jgi:hypothetical protein
MRLVPAQRPVETGEPVFADPGYVDAQLDIPISSQRRSYRASRAWMRFRSETPRARVLFCRHTNKIGARQAHKWVTLRDVVTGRGRWTWDMGLISTGSPGETRGHSPASRARSLA